VDLYFNLSVGFMACGNLVLTLVGGNARLRDQGISFVARAMACERTGR